MTITRTRIRCRERACPWPFDEDFHRIPWCRYIKGHECFGGVEHQHWPKRSQGGKEIVSLLCSGAHQLIDSGPWGNAVKEVNGKRVYMIWDLHGEILYERDIGVSSAAVEVSDGSGAGTSAVAPGASKRLEPEERVGRDSRDAFSDGADSPAAVTPPDPLACWTLEELREAADGYLERFPNSPNPEDFVTWLGATHGKGVV